MQTKFPVYLVLFFILLKLSVCFSQSPFHYVWPIDSPGVITANYGELRPNHFHAGIDFATGGKINLPVYAIEEGYVSRIRVSPYGYGKCVYITHPNGKVSVYAHLNAFSLKIANVAREFQYSTQSFEIDYMPKPRSIYVRRNEIIGLSGNTGGSTGPHLHFEIRDEKTEVPLNPLGFFRINDHSSPEIHGLALYDLADTSRPVCISTRKMKAGKKDSLMLEEDHITVNASLVGLAFSGLDRCYPKGNPNNVFSARIYVDDSLVYSHQLNDIAFSESRFINEFSQVIAKNKYQKCFLPTVYPPGMFGKCKNKGRIELSDTSYCKIKMIFSDESGNTSVLHVYLKAKQKSGFAKGIESGDVYVNCTENVTARQKDLSLNIAAGTLFYSTYLSLENTLEGNRRLSVLPEVNLKQPITIGFKVPEQFWKMPDKMLLKNGAALALPVVRGDSAFFSVKALGIFSLILDTMPPKITVNYSDRKLKEAWLMDSFSFTISDNSSGIGKYNLWLNNAWVLAEYDAKSDLLTYYFDEETPIGLLQFKVEVMDKVGNKTFLEYTLKK